MRRRKIKKYNPKKLVAVFICVAAIAFLFFSTTGHPAQTGQLEADQTYSGENLSHSLDLRLAAKAAYPSSPLNVVNDLGTSGGIKRQVVSFAVTTDHLKEYALLMKPASAPPPGGFPVLILCHGYINPEEYHTDDGYISDMEFYAGHGFLVVKPDFRGQGLSIGQGSAEGAYYSMAYNTDVMSLISSLKQTAYADKTKLNLWGHSMGAYIALRAAVISPDIKNLILLSGPVGSLRQIYLSYVPPSDENNEIALRIRNDVFAKYGTPGEDSSFWTHASPSAYLSLSKAYIQIHVGAQDPVVPNELSEDLDTSLNNLHKPHQLFVYPDGRHSLEAQRPSIWSRSLAQLQKN
jgi:uncharacterized protein